MQMFAPGYFGVHHSVSGWLILCSAWVRWQTNKCIFFYKSSSNKSVDQKPQAENLHFFNITSRTTVSHLWYTVIGFSNIVPPNLQRVNILRIWSIWWDDTCTQFADIFVWNSASSWLDVCICVIYLNDTIFKADGHIEMFAHTHTLSSVFNSCRRWPSSLASSCVSGWCLCCEGCHISQIS